MVQKRENSVLEGINISGVIMILVLDSDGHQSVLQLLDLSGDDWLALLADSLHDLSSELVVLLDDHLLVLLGGDVLDLAVQNVHLSEQLLLLVVVANVLVELGSEGVDEVVNSGLFSLEVLLVLLLELGDGLGDGGLGLVLLLGGHFVDDFGGSVVGGVHDLIAGASSVGNEHSGVDTGKTEGEDDKNCDFH